MRTYKTPKDKVAILMCTYNGEKYLKEQIDSILNQKEIDVDIYIRDDGSSDRTLDILKSYKDKVIIVKDKKNKHLGPSLGYMKLLFFVYSRCKKYDYFSFADQDDIWMENKLAIAVRALKGIGSPCLYCSNFMYFQNGKEIGLKYSERPDLSFIRHIMCNNVYGCTYVFNRSLVKEIYNGGIPKSSYFRTNYHDSWVALVAIATGKVIYDDKSYILHRIHENNELGIPAKLSRLEKKQKYGVYLPSYHVWKNTACELKKRFILTGKKKEIVQIVSEYNKSLRKKLELFNMVKNHYNSNKFKLFVQILIGYR